MHKILHLFVIILLVAYSDIVAMIFKSVHQFESHLQIFLLFLAIAASRLHGRLPEEVELLTSHIMRCRRYSLAWWGRDAAIVRHQVVVTGL